MESVFGHARPKWAVRAHVRFTPDSDRTADIVEVRFVPTTVFYFAAARSKKVMRALL